MGLKIGGSIKHPINLRNMKMNQPSDSGVPKFVTNCLCARVCDTSPFLQFLFCWSPEECLEPKILFCLLPCTTVVEPNSVSTFIVAWYRRCCWCLCIGSAVSRQAEMDMPWSLSNLCGQLCPLQESLSRTEVGIGYSNVV